MAIDTTPSTVATNALQAIPFSSLIGGPLDAAIKAQAMAAKTSWEFIQQVGLNTDATTGKKEAVNVTFFYNKNGQMTKLIVPILTIVPIPYIAIDDIQINFKANISASSSSVSETSDSTSMDAGGSAKASFGIGPFSVSAEFKANYSSKKDSKAAQDSKYSVEYTMDLAVHAGQSDMPAGLATVLNILQSSITDANKDGSFIFSPAKPLLDATKLPASGAFTLPITANIKDENGLVVAGKEIKLTVVQALTWFVPGTDLQGTTDNSGNVTINVTGTLSAPGTEGYQPVVLKLEDSSNAKLNGSVVLSVTGTLPS